LLGSGPWLSHVVQSDSCVETIILNMCVVDGGADGASNANFKRVMRDRAPVSGCCTLCLGIHFYQQALFEELCIEPSLEAAHALRPL